MSFNGKVVIVTGASSGIGAATAISFAKGVALVGRNETKLSNTAQQCAVYAAPLVISADIANEQQAATIVEKTIDHFGKLDILVNNAGISRQASVDDQNILENFDLVMNTNFRSVVQVTALAASYLKATKMNIVNVSSIAVLRVLGYNYMSYCVSKAALDHYTRCAALDLAEFSVRVNSVNPGPVKTDIIENSGKVEAGTGHLFWERLTKLTALSRVGDAEEIADLILFLPSEKARSITGSLYLTMVVFVFRNLGLLHAVKL